jgi:prevent-host-death family protein
MFEETTYNIHAAKTHLSRLAEEAAQGHVIIIAKNGKPIAKLVAIEDVQPKLPRIGALKGQFTFDAKASDAMDAEIAELFEGRK